MPHNGKRASGGASHAAAVRVYLRLFFSRLYEAIWIRYPFSVFLSLLLHARANPHPPARLLPLLPLLLLQALLPAVCFYHSDCCCFIPISFFQYVPLISLFLGRSHTGGKAPKERSTFGGPSNSTATSCLLRLYRRTVATRSHTKVISFFYFYCFPVALLLHILAASGAFRSWDAAQLSPSPVFFIHFALLSKGICVASPL